MFIEINDISTGTIITEPLNAYSINYVYSVEVNGKYRLIYMLLNGLRKIEEFDSQSDLEDRIDEIKELSGGGGGTNVYTYKGSCTFENLPTSEQVVGDVWNITNDFELDGKPYPAGTNVAWDGIGWDALAGSFTVPTITNSDIDALFNFEALFEYKNSIGSSSVYNFGLVDQGIVFPESSFNVLDGSGTDYYQPRNTGFNIDISYEGVHVAVPNINVCINENDLAIDMNFVGGVDFTPIYEAIGDNTLLGTTVVVNIPSNIMYLNGVGNEARHFSFVYGEPVDNSPYPQP